MAGTGKVKAAFTAEERAKLIEAYDAGLNSISKDNLPLIQQTAAKLQKDEQAIKVSVGF